jgi:hypothetical protein
MSETEVKRGPGRPARQEEVQQRRRRRESLGADRNMKLSVPEDFKDPNFEYRWVNDRPGRVQQLHGEDWDVVSGDVDTSSIGTNVKRVSNKLDGEHAVLMRKPKDYFEQDKAEKQAALDKVDEALRRGAPPSSEGLAGPNSYVPGGRNTVGR